MRNPQNPVSETFKSDPKLAMPESCQNTQNHKNTKITKSVKMKNIIFMKYDPRHFITSQNHENHEKHHLWQNHDFDISL